VKVEDEIPWRKTREGNLRSYIHTSFHPRPFYILLNIKLSSIEIRYKKLAPYMVVWRCDTTTVRLFPNRGLAGILPNSFCHFHFVSI
jgi:hypothetical protein